MANTWVDPPAAAHDISGEPSPADDGTHDTFLMVRSLTVRGFGTDPTGANVWMSGGTLLIENAVLSNGARYGLEVLGGTATVRSTTIMTNVDDNVIAKGNAAVKVFDSLISASPTRAATPSRATRSKAGPPLRSRTIGRRGPRSSSPTATTWG